MVTSKIKKKLKIEQRIQHQLFKIINFINHGRKPDMHLQIIQALILNITAKCKRVGCMALQSSDFSHQSPMLVLFYIVGWLKIREWKMQDSAKYCTQLKNMISDCQGWKFFLAKLESTSDVLCIFLSFITQHWYEYILKSVIHSR